MFPKERYYRNIRSFKILCTVYYSALRTALTAIYRTYVPVFPYSSATLASLSNLVLLTYYEAFFNNLDNSLLNRFKTIDNNT